MLKRILIGAAGGILAVPAAFAADLPVAPEPIDYVRVCDAFGAGFYYIPGTDTCISVRGRVRAEYRIGESELAQNYGAHWRDMNSSQFRSRGYIGQHLCRPCVLMCAMATAARLPSDAGCEPHAEHTRAHTRAHIHAPHNGGACR